MSGGNASNEGTHLTPLKGGKEMGGGGSSLIRGNHGQLMLNNVSNSGGYGQGKHGNSSKHHRGASVDVLNSSVEMRGKIHHLVGAGGKGGKHVRE